MTLGPKGLLFPRSFQLNSLRGIPLPCPELLERIDEL